METLHSIIPLLAVLVSLAVVPAIVSSRSENAREGWTFAAAFIKFGLVASMTPFVLQGGSYTFTLVEVIPGVPIAFRVDAFGMLFALVSSSLWIVTSAYSIGYMRGLDEHSQTRYFSFFAISLSATIGVAFSANLLTMYLFYEMLSFATYPLVAHHQDHEARVSGRKYIGYILGASICLALPAMLYVYVQAGNLDFTAGGVLTADTGKGTLLVLALMFVFGFAKAGVMPFHSWLPAAMVAPTPVSSLLHAVAVVKVGVFCVFRALTGTLGTTPLSDAGIGTVIAVIASITILVSSLIALSQDELKRRLAFSTIGQLSYIILGAALLTPAALQGGMMHITMHAFGKITLFFCAGAIFVASGKKYISQMKGIGRRMPVTMTAFFIGALSVIGLPPAGGFLSKWYLVIGTLEAGQIGFLAVLLFSSILNAAYFLPIVYRAFFCAPEDNLFEEGIKESPPWCLYPLCITAAGSLLLFFYPQPFFRLAQLAVSQIMGG
ncbi:monovalent cation/H+ antiporter subunit D family protein [Desulfobotulus sp. H1]|uniref:Monovalent cation/H+ antiporter subunit D family protein n=1 Tax=Desulfobotulus pelophilus TaxID=2823377 RepID=A0ABT3NBB9_9BACT|nr:monovalent cation/H+ antiporter subunit D family protein [Desulfobotulus pelophilus]MCW7754758.1 monovalent cation/H+ antiporter subunit D family protein [Desulfobotulus pelophilus]